MKPHPGLSGGSGGSRCPRRRGQAVLAAVGVLLLAPAGAHAQEPSGAVLTTTCFSCHGPGGQSAGAMPSIEGKSYDFVVQALSEFKSGEREATVMDRIAKGFTDEEIESIARYFSNP